MNYLGLILEGNAEFKNREKPGGGKLLKFRSKENPSIYGIAQFPLLYCML